MKKLILIFLFIPLVFTCSSDDESSDNNQNNNDGVLPSTITINRVDGIPAEYITTYNYEGKKIVSIFEEHYYDENLEETQERVFTYTENKISLIQEFYDGELSKLYEINYNSQGMISEVTYINDDGEGTTPFTYNSDGITTYGNEQGYWNYIIDNNGNYIYEFRPLSNEGEVCNTTLNLEYDDYNNPFKNITGISNLGLFARFISMIDSNNEGYYGWNNNPIYVSGYTEQCEDPADNIDNEMNSIWQYDYNNNGYPRNIIIDTPNYNRIITIEYIE